MMAVIYAAATFINLFFIMAWLFAGDINGVIFSSICAALCWLGYKNSSS
jgi:hypothetical protein